MGPTSPHGEMMRDQPPLIVKWCGPNLPSWWTDAGPTTSHGEMMRLCKMRKMAILTYKWVYSIIIRKVLKYQRGNQIL